MRTNYILSAVAASLVFLTGCQKAEKQDLSEQNPTENETPVPVPGETMLFSASSSLPVLKTELSENGDAYDVIWKEGDAINVNGTTMTIVSPDDAEGYGPGTQNAHFSGYKPMANASSPVYKAIYPAGLRDRYGYYNLPAEQNYVAGNIENFPMYAETDGDQLSFRNLCGIICLNLKGDKSIASISLADKSENAVSLSGRFSVAENAAVLSSGANGTALLCSSPVALDPDSFTPFYITVPAASYGTLQIIIEASDGTICKKTSNKPIVVQRSKITPINLSSLEFKDESTRIYYTTTGTVQFNQYAASADASVFGDGLHVVSHSYDSGTKTGVIALDGPVTTIGNRAFSMGNYSVLKSVTIPNTVTSLGTNAFASCGNLESVNFPTGLTIVGNNAFVNCSKFVPGDLSHLTSIGESAFQSVKISGALTIPEGLTLLGKRAFSNCDNITEVLWGHTPETMGIEIFYSCDGLEKVSFADDIAIPGYMFDYCVNLSEINFDADVTAIGDYAFRACRALTAFVIPETVETVGQFAFTGCTSLASVDFGKVTYLGQKAFENCTALTEAILPQTLTQMAGNGTFRACTSLVRVVFPENSSFTTIPQYCFSGCTSLVSTSIPSNITSIEAYVFQNCGLTALPEGWGRQGISYGSRPYEGCPIESVTFPDNWTNVPAGFCASWKQLRKVHLGSGITRLNDGAFDSCISLTDGADIMIPSQLNYIGSNCFNKSGLTSLPSGINRSGIGFGNNLFAYCPLSSADVSAWTSVPNSCFSNCSGLSSVTLGDGLLSIAAKAFLNCGSLTAISLPVSLDSMGQDCFAGSGLSALPAGFHACSTMGNGIFKNTQLTEVVLPEGVTSLPDYCFDGCASLRSVNLNGVQTVGSYAFRGCPSLSSIATPFLITIGDYALSGNVGLVSVSFPLVETLGNYVFSGCTALKTVDLGVSVRTLKLQVFNSCNALEGVYIRNTSAVCSLDRMLKNAAPYPPVYVPADLVDQYKATSPWSDYSDNIFAIGDGI